MKWATVVGARPQFIKAASLSRAIARRNERALRSRQRASKKRIEEVLIHTGQHYDYLMDRVFFEELEIPEPDYHLGVGSASHGRQTARMLEGLEEVLEKERPDLVIVYGDTNSTLAGALAAAKLHLPVVHVEAGLRSYNRNMPEEINRVLTDHLSTFLFCPTETSVRNLKKEGIQDGGARVVTKVGDVMYDSVLHYSRRADAKATILRDLGFEPEASGKGSDSTSRDYYLVTLHRAENTDDRKRLLSILSALDEIAKRAAVILPLHPRTEKRIEAYGLTFKTRRLTVIQPVSYLNMLKLEKHARAILTDSGGVQKEAFWLGVPCLTLREETEWVETVHRRGNLLVGADKERILEGVQGIEKRRFLKSWKWREEGNASARIVETLLSARPE
jgi:UDP-GlcNAc3NAcA epimerase